MELTKRRARQPSNWKAALVATLLLWIIPIVVRMQPRNDGPPTDTALACLIGLVIALGVCAKFRQARWIILIWVPLLFWTGLGAVKTFGAIASGPHGGPNAAPLEGIATLIVLAVGLSLSIGAVLGLLWRPRVFSVPLVILAIANTSAVSYLTPLANRQATRQDIILHILDSKDRPLPGAEVRYTRYSYGSGGRDVLDTDGGPLLSGADGVVIIPSRRMRYKTKGTISKTGFRDVLFTVEMQYSKWDRDRGVTVSTRETANIAHSRIPATDPVTLSIYIPPLTDAPDRSRPVKSIEARSDIGNHPDAARFLNAETGKFSTDPTGDIRFDLFFEMDGQYERPRLRVTGLNGTKILQVPPSVSLSGTLSPYEHVFRVAPEDGYQDEVVIQQPGSSPEPMIYVSARGGRFYALMTVDGLGLSNETKARCSVRLFTNHSGSRLLE